MADELGSAWIQALHTLSNESEEENMSNSMAPSGATITGDIPPAAPRKAQKKAPAPTGIIGQLLEAQAAMPPVSKGRMNPFTRSKYADLGDIMAAARPVLAAHGLFLTQDVTRSPGEREVTITTAVYNAAGEVFQGAPLAVPLGGGTPAQAVGAASTYGRRYSLCALLGIVAEDDDDGNGPAPHAAMPAPADPGLAQGANAAAAQGAEAYKAFWAGLTGGQRKALIDSGDHARIKSQLGV